MTAREIVEALGGHKNGRGWLCKCPAHNDANPSLSIDEGREGKVLLRCRAGCTQDAVLSALRQRGLWPEARRGREPGPTRKQSAPATSATLRHATLGEPHFIFEYHDAKGTLLGAVCRWEFPPPREKEIRPAIRVANGWRWAGFPTPRPLYRLSDLSAHADRPVLVVEGEKTADCGREIIEKFVVVTWPGGVETPKLADWSPLKGRNVTLMPDNDEAGKRAMWVVADNLVPIAKSVRIVALPSWAPPKWDLADPIPEGLDLDQLLASARSVSEMRLAKLGLITAADLVATEFKPPRWAVPELIPEGLCIFAGRPKTGKSWMVLDFGIAIASGGHALGTVECEPGDVLALLLEDTQRRLNGRIRAVLQGAPAPRALDIATKWRRADEGGLDDIAAWIAAHPGARLVAIDTLALIRGKPDKDMGVYRDDYTAITAFKKLADETSVPIILVHHLRKGSATDPLEEVSGTFAITGSADTIIMLRREPNDPHGLLYIRGRDVLEAEIALEFDNHTGKWLRLGPEADFRKTVQRRALISALAQIPDGMTPKEIADVLSKKPGAVRFLLHKMRGEGDVTLRSNGRYVATRT